MYRELFEVYVCAFCWRGGTREGPFRKQSDSKGLLEADTSGICTKVGINPSGYAWLEKGSENTTRLKDSPINLLPYVLTFRGRWAYTSKPSPEFQLLQEHAECFLAGKGGRWWGSKAANDQGNTDAKS